MTRSISNRVHRMERLHPDTTVADILMALDLDEGFRDGVSAILRNDGRPRPSEEALAVANGTSASSESDAPDGASDEGGFSLADAMGSGEGTPLENTDTSQTSATSPGSGGTLAMPTSGLPLAQFDALAPSERRRAAKRLGLTWPTTEEARNRLTEGVFEIIREEDDRVVDAPISLGKTHTIASTRWGARLEITGDRPVVHLLQTRDARDEAVEVAQEDGGEHFVLRARHEACPVAAGDHDPVESQDSDTDRQVITIDGRPASEWLAEICDRRGIAFSDAHRYLEEHNDQDATMPCCHDETKCPAIKQWETFRKGDHSLVIATHNFAHVPGLRMQTNLVLDEEPDFTQDLSTDDVRQAVTVYLQEIDATVQTWESFIQLSRHEGYESDAANERGFRVIQVGDATRPLASGGTLQLE